ncbi:uncharacterized protein LOC123320515 [Coccinella septempunctata]|uniref:uncharacterized protein LOC123320515 n=1 Tax=Coccinella septempunctata TaxID=41139 RepID=UPI001D076805|nr:uncharacterized protein LOC123320515 [Coccinella septempunctata]
MRMSIKMVVEISAIEIILGTEASLVLAIYRPSGEADIFFDTLEKILNVLSGNKRIIITGDFNINMLNQNHSNTQIFKQLLYSYGVTPTIMEPTRITATTKTCIDNILTNYTEYEAGTFPNHMSDHNTTQTITLKWRSTEISRNYIYKRVVNEYTLSVLKEELKEENWDGIWEIPQENVDEQWNSFLESYTEHFKYACPLKKIDKAHNTKKLLKMKPNEEQINCKKKLDILYTLKTFNQSYNEDYKKVKREYDSILRKQKCQVYKGKILTSDNKSKSLWQCVKDIKGAESRESIRLEGNPKQIATDFNHHFSTAALELINRMRDVPFTHNIERVTEKLIFRQITENEVLLACSKLKNKDSCGIDGISNRVIKSSIDLILQPLTYIINNMLTYGIFPQQLKEAKVIPIYKKGDANEMSNYRPINFWNFSWRKIY